MDYSALGDYTRTNRLSVGLKFRGGRKSGCGQAGPERRVAVGEVLSAGPAIRNHVGRTAWDEAMLQVGRSAETYFPPRPVAVKNLDTAIALLRSASEAPH